MSRQVLFSMKVAAVVTLLFASVSFGFDYDEAVDGPLSRDFNNPTLLVPELGVNTIIGRSSVAIGVPVWTMDIPEGWTLTSLTLDCNVPDDNWVEVFEGPTFLPGGPGGGIHHSICPSGTENLLPFGGQGGTYEVGTGEYSFGVNIHAYNDSTDHSFVLTMTFAESIPTTSDWGLVVMGLGALTAGTCIFRCRPVCT